MPELCNKVLTGTAERSGTKRNEVELCTLTQLCSPSTPEQREYRASGPAAEGLGWTVGSHHHLLKHVCIDKCKEMVKETTMATMVQPCPNGHPHCLDLSAKLRRSSGAQVGGRHLGLLRAGLWLEQSHLRCMAVLHPRGEGVMA